jgi:hypothetical protein
MTAEYAIIPRATSAPFAPVAVALAAATTKTVVQVATPSTTDIKILAWGVSFDAAATAQPGWAQLLDCDVAASVTTFTPELWGNGLQQASLCIGGASATGYNASAEGTLTVARGFDTETVFPQSGYSVWFPDTHLPRVAPSRFLRIRCNFPAIVNVYPWIVWAEPAI